MHEGKDLFSCNPVHTGFIFTLPLILSKRQKNTLSIPKEQPLPHQDCLSTSEANETAKREVLGAVSKGWKKLGDYTFNQDFYKHSMNENPRAAKIGDDDEKYDEHAEAGGSSHAFKCSRHA